VPLVDPAGNASGGLRWSWLGRAHRFRRTRAKDDRGEAELDICRLRVAADTQQVRISAEPICIWRERVSAIRGASIRYRSTSPIAITCVGVFSQEGASISGRRSTHRDDDESRMARGDSESGRGWFRTSDLSRVKRQGLEPE
jgi:hypothetical protein